MENTFEEEVVSTPIATTEEHHVHEAPHDAEEGTFEEEGEDEVDLDESDVESDEMSDESEESEKA